MGYRLGSVEFQKQRQAKEQEIKNRQAGAGIKPPSALVPVLPSQEPELVTEVEPAQKEPQYLAPEPPMGDRLAGDEKPIQLSGIEKKVYGALTGKDPSAAERPTVKDIQVGTEAAASPAAVDTIPKQEDRDWYVERMNSLVEARNQAYNTYAKGLEQAESEKERRDMAIAFGKILETLGHGLIKIGAANYGLKKGVDMSGLKFDKNDWDASFQLSQRSYEARLGSLQGMLAEKEKSLRGLEEEAGALKLQEEKTKAQAEKDRQDRIWKATQEQKRMDFEKDQNEADRILKRKELELKQAERQGAKQVAEYRKNLKEQQRDITAQLNRLEAENKKAAELLATGSKDIDNAVALLNGLAYLPRPVDEAGNPIIVEDPIKQKRESLAFYKRIFTSDNELFRKLIQAHVNTVAEKRASLNQQKEDLDYLDDYAENAMLDKLKEVPITAEIPSEKPAPLPSTEPERKILLNRHEFPPIGGK